jgi:hypothetical protein
MSDAEALDLSTEFLELDALALLDRLDEARDAKNVVITVDWMNVSAANRLKAFLESAAPGQTRSASIRATRSQKSEAANAFSSGICWIPVHEASDSEAK